MERNRINPNCAELYTMGLPELVFKKMLSPSSHHASNHEPAQFVVKDIFRSLSEYDESYSSEYLQYGSSFLNLPGIRSRTVAFGEETDIQTFVATLMNDTIQLSGLSGAFRVASEWSLTAEHGSKNSSHKPDHWVVYFNGKPVAVIEVKSPQPDDGKPLEQIHVMDHPNVMGQLFDYVVGQQSFHGQHHIFAILTTLKHFRIAWLPHSDSYAASDIDSPPADAPVIPLDPASRLLHCTPLIPHTHQLLMRLLISAIKKSAGSTFGTVQAFSHQRMYLRLELSAWQWRRYPPTRAEELHAHATLNLTATANRSAHFTIIKSLYRTASCKVWVAVAGETNRVCVAKHLLDEAKLVQEQAMWHRCNLHTGVFCSRGDGEPLIIMPFVVLAREIDGVISFNTDFYSWSAEDNAIAGPVPITILQELSRTAELIAEQGWTPQSAAAAAAARFADQGVLHQDLEWRHVGILPLYNKNEVVDVRPVFIDFDKSIDGVEPGLALLEMQNRLAFLATGVSFA